MAELSEQLLPKLEEMAQQFTELEAKLSDPAVVSDPDQLRELSIKRAALVDLVERYHAYQALAREIGEHETLVAEDEDPELTAMAKDELPGLRERAAGLLEETASLLVTADDLAVGSVMLEIRGASGGAEAALWAGDLFAMYQKYAVNKGWKMELLEMSAGEAGGVRQVVANVKGTGVWQGLGYEGGVHCVKRVPATESQGRVHTSTATVAVLPEPEKVALSVPEDEVEIHVTTAQGPGGQNVNKVATAVHMIHKPTGIEVRMQESKSQHQNREKAWQLLRARLYDYYQRQKDAERAESRSAMIGSGGRSERIRTYRYKETIVVDHRLGETFNLDTLLAGNMDELVAGLIAQDRAQRLAAL